jgi:uncharacterized protein (TIGR03435 family)
MKSFWLLGVVSAILLVPFARAQSAGAKAVSPYSYDAVTIKPNKSVGTGTSVNVDDDAYRARNVSIMHMLVNAYEIRPGLISGLPGWADSARFDVAAKIVDYDPKSNLTREQRRAMLAAMLEERFHLKVHIETKELPVYELVLAKDGSKLKASPGPVGVDSGNMDVHSSGGIVELSAAGVPMASLALNLSAPLDRTVIDKTGLKGGYDFHLKWTADNAPQPLPDDAPPLLFTAIQEQLGLRLQAAKGPVDTLVVDHVEMPTEN